jgi:hypothetical protein
VKVVLTRFAHGCVTSAAAASSDPAVGFSSDVKRHAISGKTSRA